MIAIYISTAIEAMLILLLSWGAAYTLQTSYVFGDVVDGFAYLYPLTTTQVYVLIFILVSLLGIFLVFAFDTKGLKWFIIPLVALCVPSAISKSDLPRYFEERFDTPLELDILRSDISPEGMLLVVLLLVAGFLVLYQMVGLRAMSTHLSWRGVDESDVSGTYKGRGIFVIALVLVSVAASYLVNYYTTYFKDLFQDRLNLDPLLYLVIGIAAGFAAVAIIIAVLVIQRPKVRATEPQPEKFRHKAAAEARAVLHIFVPSALTKPVGRLMASASRPLIRAVRLGTRRIKSWRGFKSTKREE